MALLCACKQGGFVLITGGGNAGACRMHLLALL